MILPNYCFGSCSWANGEVPSVAEPTVLTLLCIYCPSNLSQWLIEIQRTQHASSTTAMTFMPLQQTTPPCELSMRLEVATVGTVHSSQTTVVENDMKSWERVPEIWSDLVHMKTLLQKQENTLVHTWNVQIHWWLLIAVQFDFQQAAPGQLAKKLQTSRHAVNGYEVFLLHYCVLQCKTALHGTLSKNGYLWQSRINTVARKTRVWNRLTDAG